MTIDLSTGIRATVRQPQTPRVVVAAPTPTRNAVIALRGPQGPPGIAGGAFTQRQDNAASQWTVTHNLGIWPVPVILLDDHPTNPVLTDVTYVDNNTFILTFPTPVTGVVHIN